MDEAPGETLARLGVKAASRVAGVLQQAVERRLLATVQRVGARAGPQQLKDGSVFAVTAGRVQGRVAVHAVTCCDVTSGAEEGGNGGGVEGDGHVQGSLFR